MAAVGLMRWLKMTRISTARQVPLLARAVMLRVATARTAAANIRPLFQAYSVAVPIWNARHALSGMHYSNRTLCFSGVIFFHMHMVVEHIDGELWNVFPAYNRTREKKLVEGAS